MADGQSNSNDKPLEKYLEDHEDNGLNADTCKILQTNGFVDKDSLSVMELADIQT